MMTRLFLLTLAFLASSGISQDLPPPPENDRCVNAITLEPGEPVDGDNTNANHDYVNQGVCGPRSDRRALWYEIIGTGKNVTVYVCTNNEKITDYGVFHRCNTQQCVGGPPQLTEPANCDEGEANTFEFETELGEDYFVHVRSDTLDPVGSNFTIWYTEPPSEAPSMAPTDAASIPASSAFSVIAAAVAVGWLFA